VQNLISTIIAMFDIEVDDADDEDALDDDTYVQQDSLHIPTVAVATPLWPSVGVKPNTWKSWRLRVFQDSRMFRA